MNKDGKMELILFDKYLIRTDEYNYLFSILKDDREPIVKKIINKNNNVVSDYSNFSDPIFPRNFYRCLKLIKENEISSSNVRNIDELIELLNEIDNKINYIKNKFR